MLKLIFRALLAAVFFSDGLALAQPPGTTPGTSKTFH